MAVCFTVIYGPILRRQTAATKAALIQRDATLMLLRSLLACLCLVPVVWILAIFPISPWLLAAAVALYAGLLWRWPVLFLLVLPAVLPALDLGLWTGWTTVEVPDLFVLATLAVLILRSPPHLRDVFPGGWMGWVLLLLIASIAIGTVTGLASPLGFTGHSDNPYLRPDNALRLLKGPLEALVLLPFMRRRQRTHDDAPIWLGWGLAAGLAAVTLEVGLERALFVGLMDFSSDYRVVGPFISMRIGGGHIGAYIAMVLPFVLSLGLARARVLTWPLLILIGLGGAYSLAVTFARTAYVAAVGSCGTAGLGLSITAFRGKRGAIAFAVIQIVLVVAVLGSAASSELMRQRFSSLAEDLLTRENNWREGWSVRDQDVLTDIFGMGLGTYQRTMLSRAKTERPSDLSVETDSAGAFVSLRALTPFYFGQKIASPPSGPMRLNFRFRADMAHAGIAFIVCDKVLLYSHNCRSGQVTPMRPGEWVAVSALLDGSGLGAVTVLDAIPRPVELALFATTAGSTIAFRDVSLRDAGGRELLANGDFSHGLDRWLFTDDDHLAWRIKNQYVMRLFELGAVGLLSLLAVCGLALAGSIRATLRGDPMGGIVAGAVVAFMISGISDDVLEVPKIATLFFLICFAGLLLWEVKPSHPPSDRSA
jgi:hypothetical protein